MNDQNIWIEKYKPTKISEITTNLNAVKTITEWINNFENYKKEA